jgi:hypothetical protein
MVAEYRVGGPKVSNASTVFAYELTTALNAEEAAVEAVSLAILHRRTDINVTIWTVAATIEQGMRFRALPWVIKRQPLGPMSQVDRELVYRVPRTVDQWSVPIEALHR